MHSESANFSKLERFFGRDSELDRLADLLGRSTYVPRYVSIHGPPGIGKSQFVNYYINAHRRNYDNIFCLDGSTIERLRLTLRRETNRIRQSWSDLLFKALKLADTHSGNIDRFCTFLNSHGNDHWLLVIDELRESTNVNSILSRLKQGTIILVSTSSQPANDHPAVKLGPLEHNASVELLRIHSRIRGIDTLTSGWSNHEIAWSVITSFIYRTQRTLISSGL